MSTKTIKLSDGTNTLLPESAESTVDDNGIFVLKLADGTLIQAGRFAVASISGSSVVNQEVSFPKSFVGWTPIVICVPKGYYVTTNFWSIKTMVLGTDIAKFNVRIVNDSSSAQTNVACQYIAIGRWK